MAIKNNQMSSETPLHIFREEVMDTKNIHNHWFFTKFDETVTTFKENMA